MYEWIKNFLLYSAHCIDGQHFPELVAEIALAVVQWRHAHDMCHNHDLNVEAHDYYYYIKITISIFGDSLFSFMNFPLKSLNCNQMYD